MLVDEAQITVRGGHGGAGKVSFYKPPMKGPDGGNGGKGGDVYLLITSDLSALNKFTSIRTLSAQDGEAGGSNRKFGKDGKDLEIKIPVGSLLTDLETGESIELDEVGNKILICRGGKGGKGNYEFKSPSNTTPEYAQPGLKGEERRLKISLRFIAEIGLIGLPNAGKSSLLNELTNSNVKTADYPFTTLEANLGVHDGKTIADIPGLIEGASEGKGLGHRFLKHIEKVKLLLHCITSENEDVLEVYKTIREEMKKFNPELIKKQEVIILTKSDLLNKDQVKEKTVQLKKTKKKVLPVSIHNWDSLEELKELLRE